jgi:hypothetical protein
VVLELVEALPPHLAVGLEPSVKLHQRLNPDAVQAALAGGTDLDQTGVAKHPQMLRHRRLTDRQPLNQRTDRPLPLAQLIEDQASAGLGDDLDRGLS